MRTFNENADRIIRLAVAYSDANDETPAEEAPEEAPAEDTQEEGETFSIPEDFSELNDEQLSELHSEAVSHFDSLYGDGTGLTDEDLETLAQLTEGIESLSGEVSNREAAAEERSAKAREMAAKVKPESAHGADTDSEGGSDAEDEDDDADDSDDDSDDDNEDDSEDESAAKTVTASGKKRKPVNVNLSRINARSKHQAPAQAPSPGAPKSMKDLVAGADGEGANWNDLSRGLDRRLASFPVNQYAMANKRSQHMREQHNLAVIRKPYAEDQLVASADPDHIESVMNRAVDESKLPQGSLVASGGWCAPSETLYDFLEMESRDGLLSVPEIGITRGGIQFTQGPRFSDIYAATGFSFTEQDDIDGNYGGEDGNKPFYKIECPTFTEARLEVDGLYLTAGILQQRGYPEIIARTLRGALVAHDHKMTANAVARMAEDSTQVTMPGDQVGAAAPILNTIELQVAHYRYSQRLSLNTTLEAIFPAWTHGVIKADLARRDGLDYLAVTDAQVNAWFGARGIAPQFIYNWQAIDETDASEFTAWPESLDFLLYVAGTWVRGTSDIITLDTIYDSVNLAQNDYIALFSEEGSLMAKRGHDSRLVTVPMNASGSVGDRVMINHDGTAGAVSGGDAGGEG